MIGYRIELTPDDNSTLLVTCPDLPGVVTFGETEAEAVRWASDAIETFIASSLRNFEPVARPSDSGGIRASVSLQTSMVLQLYWALNDRGWTRADLQRALGWHRPQVDRLFDPNHASTLPRFEAAFRALGIEPDIVAKAA
jgi:antitoxin HicB